MPGRNDISWFKQQFHKKIEMAVDNTPFDLDMLTAIACQETGYIWQVLRRQDMPLARLLELCVGDTLDEDRGRSAFPRTKARLIAAPNGQAMFNIARQALVDMARYITSYRTAAANPNKFCHGFGVFQFDLQFFKTEPNYFLQKRYANFDSSLQKCVQELHNAVRRMGWQQKTSLSDYEMACVAIAYNAGSFKQSRGLKQGHRNAAGKYYGEEIFDFLRLSRTVPLPPQIPEPAPGQALVPPPTEVEAGGKLYAVTTLESTLRLRCEPTIDKTQPTANVIGELPDGHIVRAVSGKKVKGFREVETSLAGAHYRGYASAKYLKLAPRDAGIAVVVPAAAAPSSGITAVDMPRRPGTVTKRTANAGAHSLNETGQPGRKGTTPDELRAELAAIVDWLAVDKPAHKRYQPRNGVTFCNIYGHDYCYLAGVYFPRVWWTPGAIERLAQGQSVEPRYGDTIEEMRANDLFRWLRDFGPRFGWRQTGTLSKLQQEVNQGAIGLIVARRHQDGPPGHITAVLPETDDHQARRNSAGEVIAPLQSQAGSENFRRKTGRLNWWKDARFAESAFWLHS